MNDTHLSSYYTDYCINHAFTHDRERALSAMFAPVQHRPGLSALLAFNVETARVAEVAKEEMVGLIRLQWWRDAVSDIYEGKAAQPQAIVEELRELIATYNLPQQAFDALLTAREQELNPTPFATDAQAEFYAQGTGGTLFSLWGQILGADDEVRQQCAEIGALWARLGVLRSVHFVAHQGRVRLSAERLARFDLSPHKLLQEGFGERFNDMAADSAREILEQIQQLRQNPYAKDKRWYSVYSLLIQAEDVANRIVKAGGDVAAPSVQGGRMARAFKMWWHKFSL